MNISPAILPYVGGNYAISVTASRPMTKRGFGIEGGTKFPSFAKKGTPCQYVAASA